MKRLKVSVLLFICYFGYQNECIADLGCFFNGDNVIYTNDTGIDEDYYVLIFYIGTYRVYNTPLSTIPPSCPRAILGAQTSTRCLVNGNRGRVYNYTYITRTTSSISCPLDDYIWLLILPVSGLGFYTMRKRIFFKLQGAVA